MFFKIIVRKRRKIEFDNEEEQESVCIEYVSQGEEYVEKEKNESEVSEEEDDQDEEEDEELDDDFDCIFKK